MEVYRTENGHVAKYVHDDGSETAIKTIPEGEVGCGGYGNIGNKYNIFISSSVGCPVNCKFCYLTVKKCPYHKLSAKAITLNVLDALNNELEVRPELRNMYTKLSWMGMGDAFLDLETVYDVTEDLIQYIQSFEMSAGIDGVDIATTLPKIPTSDINYVRALSDCVWDAHLNPKRAYIKGTNRQPFRIFYSLHSAKEDIRESLIPHSVDVLEAVNYLKQLELQGITVILHHMFFDGVNDDLEDVHYILSLLTLFNNIELRLLRFNKCDGTSFEESKNFDKLVDLLYETHRNIKTQISPGEEVFASCGMFLLSKFIK